MTIMEISLKKNVFLLVVILLFVFSGCNSKEQSKKNNLTPEKTGLNSSEYKLLLNPEKFDDFESGFENYWKIVQEVAALEGIAVKTSDQPLKLKQKQVSFFDTKNLDLHKSGFLLRMRTKYKKGKETPGNEFTLKYVRPTAEEALAIDLTLGEGYKPKDDEIELESDIVYFTAPDGKPKTIYTLANSTVIEKQPDMTIATFSAIFPILNKLEVPATTEIIKVAGLSAMQWKISPGEIDFGDKLIAEMDITIWLVETENGLLKIPEFSFDHGYNKDHVWDKKAMQNCTTFINKLHDSHPEWIVPGSGKSTKLFELN